VRRGGILERCWSLRVERIYLTDIEHLFILRFFPTPRARVTFRPHAVQFRPEPAVGQLDALHGAQGESDPTPKAFWGGIEPIGFPSFIEGLTTSVTRAKLRKLRKMSKDKDKMGNER